MPEDPGASFLAGLRVIELADELGEYCGKVLAGIGADVVKVEPPGGEITRSYGPFVGDVPDGERSLYFWHYNVGKRGVTLDLDTPEGQAGFRELVRGADVLIDARPRTYLADRGLDGEDLLAVNPDLIHARISPFGDDGPWRDFTGSDLVHLALGGVAMNCGYDPLPDGTYNTPPIAPQLWQSYQIAGEFAVMGILGAAIHRQRTGQGQRVTTSVHQAVSSNTESDVPSWVYRRMPHVRQTCRHSLPTATLPAIAMTQDGRWLLPYRTYLPAFGDTFDATVQLLKRYDAHMDLDDPRFADPAVRRSKPVMLYVSALVESLIKRLPFDRDLWREAQELGMAWAPCRKPEENVADEHWTTRETFIQIEQDQLGGAVTSVGAKWYAPEVPWRTGPRAPHLGEHNAQFLDVGWDAATASRARPGLSVHGRPTGELSPRALEGVKVVDLAWLLASAGAGRFLAAMGAEVIKVEHASRLDTMRFGPALAPDGGRAERDAATGPITVSESTSPNRSGMFMDINSGKRAMSLNLKTARGKQILEELLRGADVVVEGFSPGTMDRMGLGYEALREINPRLVYVQQSGMGQVGTYGRLRSYGPTAQAFTGLSEMSGLPEPYPPAGIGYSYLDWFGAYNLTNAVLAGLYRQRATGRGCWIDSSQAETGIFLTGTAVLDHQVNGRSWHRFGNRSPYKPAAPHGNFRCRGEDRWIAISCFDDGHWRALVTTLGRPSSLAEDRFTTLAGRLAGQDDLERLVAEATSAWDAYELMDALQRQGVPAGVCQTAEDRCEHDPQLAHLGWMVDLPQSELGTWPVRQVPVTFSATPAHVGGLVGRSGPNYGEDNDYVYGELLGLDQQTQRALRDDGVM